VARQKHLCPGRNGSVEAAYRDVQPVDIENRRVEVMPQHHVDRLVVHDRVISAERAFASESRNPYLDDNGSSNATERQIGNGMLKVKA
jgi:hypothetical protein